MEVAAQPGDRKLLSCVHCRQRKVKCSRVYPCNQCVRQQLECHFPSRKKNQKRQARRQDELLGRLARLEAIVGQVESSGLNVPISDDVADETDGDQEPPPALAADPASAGEIPNPPGPLRPPVGSRPAPDPTSRYLSRDFWSNLCSEVEGLKQALEQPSESEEEDAPEDESTPASHQSASTPKTSHALLGTPASSSSEPLPHPSKEHICFLSRTYWSNVDPVLKVLHRPTLEPALKSFALDPETAYIDKVTETLFFAMYFGALASLKPEACLQNLGEERSVLYRQYRLNLEIALARADYLNSSRLEPLQAFTIYVACLRADDFGRSSWALLALAVRLAQALNLHRDGSGAAFSPFEAEMRRRLWCQLVILDVRAVEDRGSQPLLTRESYNTTMITNIDDADFGPDTTAPLVAADGHTDVTFVLCSAMASGIFLYLSDPAGRLDQASKSVPTNPPQTEEQIIRGVQELEAMFLSHVDPDLGPSMLAAATVRVIVLKLWLLVQYPFHMHISPTFSRPKVSREDMLRTAVAVMELSEASETGPMAERFSWWTDTYVQWHPLVVALVELCTQTQGALPDHAWKVIDRVLPRWSEKIADTKRGTLWRPIRKLVKKARAARLESQLKGLGLGPDVNYRVMKEGEDGTAKEAVPWQNASTDASQGGSAEGTSIPPSQGPMDSVGSPMHFLLQQPMDWFSVDWIQSVDFGGVSSSADDHQNMDWTTWDEFLADTIEEQPTNYGDF
ncbi:hypothetical protein GQ53DRAFT_801968 [Thozetella sp. PMI_491]|nr:hypothetical protein GQ53DRAFT_801968 [Thozetella sp. PMI_491]